METTWEIVRYIHLLAMAFFVGGQLVLVVAVVPVERSSPDRERMRAIARRFGYGTLVAVVVLLVTGSAMATHYHLWENTKLQIKLSLVLAIGLLLLWHIRRPTNRAIDAAIFLISLVIVWLGITLAY